VSAVDDSLRASLAEKGSSDLPGMEIRERGLNWLKLKVEASRVDDHGGFGPRAWI
jgi:hypothetical protein